MRCSQMNEYDESTGDFCHVRDPSDGLCRSGFVKRTIFRRRTRRSERSGGLDGFAAVYCRRSCRPAAMD